MLKILLWHVPVTLIIFLVGVLYIAILSAKYEIPRKITDKAFDSFKDKVNDLIIKSLTESGPWMRMLFTVSFFIGLPGILIFWFGSIVKEIDDYRNFKRKSP